MPEISEIVTPEQESQAVGLSKVRLEEIQPRVTTVLTRAQTAADAALSEFTLEGLDQSELSEKFTLLRSNINKIRNLSSGLRQVEEFGIAMSRLKEIRAREKNIDNFEKHYNSLLGERSRSGSGKSTSDLDWELKDFGEETEDDSGEPVFGSGIWLYPKSLVEDALKAKSFGAYFKQVRADLEDEKTLPVLFDQEHLRLVKGIDEQTKRLSDKFEEIKGVVELAKKQAEVARETTWERKVFSPAELGAMVDKTVRDWKEKYPYTKMDMKTTGGRGIIQLSGGRQEHGGALVFGKNEDGFVIAMPNYEEVKHDTQLNTIKNIYGYDTRGFESGVIRVVSPALFEDKPLENGRHVGILHTKGIINITRR